MSLNSGEDQQFLEHAKKAAGEYREVRPTYETFALKLEHLLRDLMPSDWPIHSINSRAKKLESFEKKAATPYREDDSKPWEPKYPKPLEQITDLAGIRVISFFPKNLVEIMSLVEREFQIQEKRDVGEERFTAGRFGYQSIHYLVKLKDERSKLPENAKYADHVAEIQIRTILQHAWAEMEHDIKYKSVLQIPKSIERRFTALAGMIEIADREFQAIQDEDTMLKSVVRASLQDDLTISALHSSAAARSSAEITDQRSASDLEVTAALENQPGWTVSNARALLSGGDYQKAISLYSNMISAEPTSYTLYIGRAKARFLAGDLQGALVDLNYASEGRPNDESIPRLRLQMEEGYLPTKSAADAWQLSTKGNEKLSLGDGEEAFKLYSQAQEQGFNYVFSTFNKAMALALVKDHLGSLYSLDQLRVSPGTPTAMNTLALRAIDAAIGKSSYASALWALKQSLHETPAFDFNQSPLRHLEQGFYARDKTVSPQIEAVFGALRRPTN